ncbi:PREDICTED: iron-sulfur assembly protein IscA, chloroplastic isoform X1 [Camelina sativa]|uniref:Iron-sulfur assembly protein IscA, chloroplastic isoform X1 n=1 Tax=Camelina sativa TaxID=90675 RepID=A0ABM0WTG1_CAMSA|nr:PREDICTED: iron-sulfur assembly protein IscA, chloroplastic isoform X1 [Camelina sativa]
MAFAGITTTSNPTFLGLRISNTSLRSVVSCNSISFPCLSYVNLNLNLSRRNRLYVRSTSVPAAPSSMEGLKPAISLSDNALKHLSKMRSERGEDLCLRIGVKQGGCSGMSYTMDFENRANARPDDSNIEYEGFTIVCDPKSMLFLFGMQLDYSDALIGGGFSFTNPNATQTCGCGKSFAAEM